MGFRPMPLELSLYRKPGWIVPWTPVTGPALAARAAGEKEDRLTVEWRGNRITILPNGELVAVFDDASLNEGYAGMAHYGSGRTLFRNFRVEGSP